MIDEVLLHFRLLVGVGMGFQLSKSRGLLQKSQEKLSELNAQRWGCFVFKCVCMLLRNILEDMTYNTRWTT